MRVDTPLLDHYRAAYSSLEGALPAQAQRQAALERFLLSGFPSARDEYWKYSDPRPLTKASHTPAPVTDFTLAQAERLMPANLDALRMVFVNGRYRNDLSTLTDLPAGLALGALSTAGSAENYDQIINGFGHALTDMNSAFAVDGAVLNINANVCLERPIYLLFVGDPTGDSQMVQLRNLLQLDKGAQATVIEHYVSTNETAYLNSCISEISLAENARLSRIRIQQESGAALLYGASFVEQARDSHLNLHSIDIGGRWQRYDTQIRLIEPGAEAHLDGLYVPTGRQHIDNHTCVEHVAPHCVSREDYKGILDGASRGVFNGRIVVHKDAQKTDSEQSSAALLLSGKAEIDAKPELEIYADDVKCKHGATVGQLDERAVFYLQSRGVSEAEARNLLTYSFADELIQRIGIDALEKHIEAAVLAKLPQGEQFGELL